FDGALGELLQARGSLEVGLFDFIQIEGDFALERASGSFALSNGGSVSADYLTLGASGVDAFVGLNAGTPDAVGFELTGMTLALALINDQNSADSWTTLKADVESASFAGLDASLLQLGAESMELRVNQTSGSENAVIDYSETPFAIATGPS